MKKSELAKKLRVVFQEELGKSPPGLATAVIALLDEQGIKPLKYRSSGCLHSMRDCCDCRGEYSAEWDQE